MPSIANATPQSRARELPDEFIVHQNQLFCKWCSKVLYSLRKDNIHEHLYSRVHQDNRRIQGAKMSYDPDCPERMKRKEARKAAQRKRKQEKQMQAMRVKHEVKPEEFHGGDMHYASNDVIDLENLFVSDDSDDSSFEGFQFLGDGHSNVDVKPESSSSQISSTSKRSKAAAKSRNMDYAWQDSAASSDEDDDYYNYPIKEGSQYDDDDGNQSEDDKQPMNTSQNVYDFSDDQTQDGGCEVVETEVVEVDEAEVVTWDSYLGQKASTNSHRGDVTEDSGSNLELESVVDDSSNQTATTTIQMTEEQHLAERVSHAREMAKSVKSTDFKKKNKKSFDDSRSDTKKNAPKKHKQQTGYMLWASKMRRHVSTKYPGMAFGEVSKKLGELWKKCSDKERQMWKFRSEKMFIEMEKSSETTKRKLGSRMIETGPPKKKSTSSSSVTSSIGNYSHYSNVSNSASSSGSANLIQSFGTTPPHRNPEQQMQRELAKLPAPSIQPIDAAAHIHIMSEHLLKTGDKIRVTGEYDTSEIINKTLDTLMCTIAPLLTLTKKVSGLEGCIPDKILSETYSNIAHLMPTDS